MFVGAGLLSQLLDLLILERSFGHDPAGPKGMLLCSHGRGLLPKARGLEGFSIRFWAGRICKALTVTTEMRACREAQPFAPLVPTLRHRRLPGSSHLQGVANQ